MIQSNVELQATINCAINVFDFITVEHKNCEWQMPVCFNLCLVPLMDDQLKQIDAKHNYLLILRNWEKTKSLNDVENEFNKMITEDDILTLLFCTLLFEIVNIIIIIIFFYPIVFVIFTLVICRNSADLFLVDSNRNIFLSLVTTDISDVKSISISGQFLYFL